MNETALKEAREVFLKEISKESNPDRVATLELLREYFTNPAFKKYMEDETFKINSGRKV